MTLRRSACALALAGVVLGRQASAQDLAGGGELVTIRRVGYPEARVGLRSACGQRQVEKNALNPDYFLHTLFGGFREGTCAQIGYTQYEESKVIGEGPPLPFFGQHNTSYQVYSRDPTTLDVAGCIGRECEKEMSALQSSRYVKDVAHCISPAFGPCAPKAWACLGDKVCKSALQCLPHVAKTCGGDVWKVVTDPEERKKLTCIWQCNQSKTCVLMKCGKAALECISGWDPTCHKAAVCVPEETIKCSLPAFNCIFSEDGVCRDNLSCLAKGANVCADAAVNMLTDKSIAGVMTCANKRCPAPAGLPTGAALHALELKPPSDYPEQLACMGLHCAGEVAMFLGDKDVKAMATCLVDGAADCGQSLWDCLGHHSCKKNMQCWADGLRESSDDIWKMVADRKERSFDKELVTCVSNCYTGRKNPFAKAFCIAATCGEKALKCLGDPACRGVFSDLPKAVLKCGPPSWKDSRFTKAAVCVAEMAESCGAAGIELVRDKNLAKIITCNAQCTRRPKLETEVVI